MKLHRRPQSVDQFFDCLEARALLGGDHPSLGDFPDATEIVLVDNAPVESSIGMEFGEIGVEGDDDLFMFEAPYSGPTAIVVAQTSVGGLAPAIQLFDDAGSPLSSLFDAPNGVAAVMPIPLTYIVQGEVYYINIKAGTPSNSNEPDITGGYMVHIVMQIPSPSQAAPGDNVFTEAPVDGASGANPTGATPNEVTGDLYVFEPSSARGDFASVAAAAPGAEVVLNDVIVRSFVNPVNAFVSAEAPTGGFALTRVGEIPGGMISNTSSSRAAKVNASVVKDDVLNAAWAGFDSEIELTARV